MGHLWKSCCHCCDHDSCGAAEIMTSLPAACDTADGLMTAMTAALAAPEAGPDAHRKDTIRAERVDSPCYRGGGDVVTRLIRCTVVCKHRRWEHGWLGTREVPYQYSVTQYRYRTQRGRAAHRTVVTASRSLRLCVGCALRRPLLEHWKPFITPLAVLMVSTGRLGFFRVLGRYRGF